MILGVVTCLVCKEKDCAVAAVCILCGVDITPGKLHQSNGNQSRMPCFAVMQASKAAIGIAAAIFWPQLMGRGIDEGEHIHIYIFFFRTHSANNNSKHYSEQSRP